MIANFQGMIRLVFSLSIVLFIAPLALLAQDYELPGNQKFSLGVKAGPSVTFGAYPDKELRDQFDALPKLGFGGGLFISFPLKKQFSFLAEGGYALRGRKVKLANGGFVNNQTYQFAEMSMALRRSFNLKVFKNIPSKWFINVGPNIAYWVNGKGKFVETKYDIKFNVPPDGNLYVNYLTNPNRWLFGIDVGVGVDAPINRRQKIRIELRATLGQTYLGKKNSSSTYASLSWEDTLKTNLKTISLTGAYTLDFDKRASKMGKSTMDKTKKKKR